jgi:5-methylcytosine-specific restriction protein A
VKSCLDCGEPIHTTRCEQHRLPEPPKPSAASRGYNNAWTRLSKRARRLQPFCTSCGATEDLQADHSPEAWARKAAGLPIRLQDIDVVCGTCNRSRGAARGYAPNRTVQDPICKARSALHTPRRCV